MYCSKGFDILNFELLIAKLKYYGFCEKALKCGYWKGLIVCVDLKFSDEVFHKVANNTEILIYLYVGCKMYC